MDQAVLREKLWAKSKPFKFLWVHLLETGIVAQRLVKDGCFYPLGLELQRYLDCSEEEMLSLVGYIAAVHDIGKAAGPFQEKISDEWKDTLVREGLTCVFPRFRHEDYGAFRLKDIWKKEKSFSLKVINRFAAVVRYHHQKTFDQGVFRKNLSYEAVSQPAWMTLHLELEEKARRRFCPPEVAPKHMDAVCTLLLGIVIAADWIASGDVFAEMDGRRLPEQVEEDARVSALDFFTTNCMLHQAFPADIKRFSELWPQIPEGGMRPLQQTVQDIFSLEDEKPLAIIIEAPMGEGKTEAGLYAAARLAQRWNKDGFYVALPTAATSNQMHGRVNGMLSSLGMKKAKLMHGMAWVVDETGRDERFFGESARDAELWTAPLRRGMIAPFAVGTIDQAMMAAMRTKYGVLRLAGLAQKVLVIDELHSYDAYMSEVIKTLLSWCRVLHIPVVMLSATLPSEKKKEFAACYGSEAGPVFGPVYPSVTLLYDEKPARVIPVKGTHQKMILYLEKKPYLGKPDVVAALVKERMDATGGCFCVLVNTVREAQETYNALRQLMPEMDGNLLLFHARFSAARRGEIEKKCIELLGSDKSLRPERFILVATQVVEQSLDLDFDFMISAVCPIDLLLQRAGRLWRHGNTKRPAGIGVPRLLVLTPEGEDFKASGMVYPPILLMRTLQAIDGKDTVHLPEDIPSLVETVYMGAPFSEEELETWMAYTTGNQLNGIEAKVRELPIPQPERFWLEDDDRKEAGVFLSDEDSAFLAAKTRLGEESRRLAILPKALFEMVKGETRICRALAKKVLQFSVSVAERKLRGVKDAACDSGEMPIMGDGLLFGLWILPGDNGICRFANGIVIHMDDELGLMIEGENK